MMYLYCGEMLLDLPCDMATSRKLTTILLCLVILLLTKTALCDDTLRTDVTAIQLQLQHIKAELPLLENRLINKIGFSETSLRVDIRDNIVPLLLQSHRQESTRSGSEVRRLKNALHQLKTGFITLSKRVKELEEGKRQCEIRMDKVTAEVGKVDHRVSDLDQRVNVNVTSQEVKQVGKTLTAHKSGLDNRPVVSEKAHERCCEVLELRFSETFGNYNGTVGGLALQNDALSRQFNRLKRQRRRQLRNVVKDARNQITKDKNLINTELTRIRSKTAMNTEAMRSMERSIRKMTNVIKDVRKETKMKCCDKHLSTPSSTVTPKIFPKKDILKKSDVNRILILQRLSIHLQNPHKLNIHKNEIQVYPHLKISNLTSATYDPISRRIIFSRYSGEVQTNGIFSFKLDGTKVKTLRLNVKSYGMAVDDRRQMIFLTTYYPINTISCMTTRGKHFRGIVDLASRSTTPFSLALDPSRQIVYFAEFDRLSAVNYNGKNMKSLVSDMSEIYAVAVDIVSNNVYFNSKQDVFMKPLPNGNVTKLLELDTDIWKVLYHRNSLYISSYNGSFIDVFYLSNNVHYRLNEMDYNNNDIVLIP